MGNSEVIGGRTIAQKKRRKLKKKFKRLFSLIGLILVGLIFAISWHHLQTSHTAQQTTQSTRRVPSKKKVDPLKKKLTAQWQALLDQTTSNVSIAVYSKKTGQTYTLTNSEEETSKTASIVKVTLLVKLMHEHEHADKKLTTTENNLAVSMIENSDNDAANTIFESYTGGNQGLNQTFKSLKMTTSYSNTSHWGYTQTTALDQLKLLNNIYYKSVYLSKSSRTYIKSLMSNIAVGQDWGVSQGASNYALKNGWLTDEDGTWIVNSIGYLGKGTNSCTIAVLTNSNATMETGEALIESIAKTTGTTLKLK
jgi:hypothetical protein